MKETHCAIHSQGNDLAAAAQSHITSHIIRWDQLLLFSIELMQKLDSNQTEDKDIW